MRYHLSIFILMTLLTACATRSTPPKEFQVNYNEVSLSEASYGISRSLVDLAEIAQAAHPLPSLPPAPAPASYGLGGLTSIDWSGPIEPLVRQVALASDYRVRVLGTPPAIPIIVTIAEKNVMLGDVIRNIGYQGGRRAAVVVYPESRVIELRYAKN